MVVRGTVDGGRRTVLVGAKRVKGLGGVEWLCDTCSTMVEDERFSLLRRWKTNGFCCYDNGRRRVDGGRRTVECWSEQSQSLGGCGVALVCGDQMNRL
ncbi:hypothetical protein ACOSQ3_019339 [Xanthoceras sorbifolium]